MKSVNMRGAIEYYCTDQRTFYSAEIDGKLFQGKNGKILYETAGGLKSALAQSWIKREVDTCADNWYEMFGVEPGSVPSEEEREKVRNRFWKKFLDGTGRCQICRIHFPE